MSAPDPVLEAAVQALRIEGGDPGSSIHGWRCEYPDRYGPCNCVAESAAEILAAVRPLIEAEVREAVARELDDRERRWRTRLDATEDLVRGTYYSGLALAYHDAARIARGWLRRHGLRCIAPAPRGCSSAPAPSPMTAT